jgi:hypothetical protein
MHFTMGLDLLVLSLSTVILLGIGTALFSKIEA